jgi:hypothetical protein
MRGWLQEGWARRRPTGRAPSEGARRECGNGLVDYESSETSSVSAESSISISRNSSESKTSPHSRHSTNSVSSCRDTTRTRGCLHAVTINRRYSDQELLLPPDCSRFLGFSKPICLNLFGRTWYFSQVSWRGVNTGCGGKADRISHILYSALEPGISCSN